METETKIMIERFLVFNHGMLLIISTSVFLNINTYLGVIITLLGLMEIALASFCYDETDKPKEWIIFTYPLMIIFLIALIIINFCVMVF